MGPEDRAPPFIGLGLSRHSWTPWSSRKRTAASETLGRTTTSGCNTDDDSTSQAGTFFSPEKSISSMSQMFSDANVDPAFEKSALFDDISKESSLNVKKAARDKARRKSASARQLVPQTITADNAHFLLHKPFFLKMVDDGSWLYVEDELYYHQVVVVEE